MITRNKLSKIENKKYQPVPTPNPNGGDPICPWGYEIDYDFDILDPKDPPFSCVSTLRNKRMNVEEMFKKMNKPESNITDLVKTTIRKTAPAAGGGRKTHKKQIRKLKKRYSKRRNQTRNRYKK